MGAHVVKEKACALCGAPMQGVDIRRKYCPDCLSAVRKVQAEEHNRKRAKKCIAKALPSGNTIRDVCARAEAAGRTYGQQVEFERRQKELWLHGKND